MNHKAQRIAIAKACGWTAVKAVREPVCSSRCVGFPDQHVDVLIGHAPNVAWDRARQDEPNKTTVPDYCNDLNAMHSAEETLTDNQVDVYVRRLSGLAIRGPRLPGARFYMWHATAHLRAEAFLKALGLWGEAA